MNHTEKINSAYIRISTYIFIHFSSKAFPILSRVRAGKFPPSSLLMEGRKRPRGPGGHGGRGGGGTGAQLWEGPRAGVSVPPPFSAGAFFIPYFIFFFTCGIPVFFLEVALGQYTSQGSVTAWQKICPLLQGECPAWPPFPMPLPSPSSCPPLLC